MSTVQGSEIQVGIDIPIQSYATITSLYLRAVILAMFSYNFMLTLDDEISYIWLKPFSFGTGFYVVGRYLAATSVLYAVCKSGFRLIIPGYIFTASCETPGLGNFAGPGPCRVGFQLQDSGEYEFPFRVMFYTSAIVSVCAMVVLQLRTYALYNKSKRIMGLFCSLNIIAVVFFVVQISAFTRLRNDPRLIDAVFGNEFFGSGTNYSPLFWAPFMLNELATFSLVAYKYWKIRRNPPILDHNRSAKNNLANVIVRDNMIYFSVIFFVYLFGLLLLANEELLFALTNTHLLGSIAISGILAPNLFLSLKKGFYEQREHEQGAVNVSDFHPAAHIGAGSTFSTTLRNSHTGNA